MGYEGTKARRTRRILDFLIPRVLGGLFVIEGDGAKDFFHLGLDLAVGAGVVVADD